MSDFLSYRNACALTSQTLTEEKRNSWKHFCFNLKPSNTSDPQLDVSITASLPQRVLILMIGSKVFALK